MSSYISAFTLTLFAVTIFNGLVMAQDIPEPNAPISVNRTRAANIYNRITGVKAPIDSQILKDMEARLNANDSIGAAALATDDSSFYNLTLKQFGAKMSTRDESITSGLSDFVATVIGIVRDDRSAKELLTGDYTYIVNEALVPQAVRNIGLGNNQTVQTRITLANPISTEENLLKSNDHYELIDRFRVDLKTVLTRREGQPNLVRETRRGDQGVVVAQPVITNNPDAAGVLTSRSFLGAHAIAGTNRRLVHFAFREFMCIDITQWADSSAPDVRVGRDVSRAPGGDVSFYLTSCKTCHSVMDGFRAAFAPYDYDGGNQFSINLLFPNQDGARRDGGAGSIVHEKYARGSEAFPAGYITRDNSWVNFARFGSNAEYFGWRGNNIELGAGANTFGRLLADSKAFSSCMVKRVFRSICNRELNSDELDMLNSEVASFESDYNLKKVFQRVAISSNCSGF